MNENEKEIKPLFEIENDFKNIFFNQDKTRKTEQEKENIKLSFFNTIREMKQRNNTLTIEYLKEVVKTSQEQEELCLSSRDINSRLSKLFFKYGIKIKGFSIDRIPKYINHLIIKKVVISQYRKNDKVEKINLYPTITEKKIIMGDKFIYVGEKTFSVGYPIRKYYKDKYHEVLI